MVLALDENPEQDFLGEMFMDLHLDYEELKQIFTPYHVCQLMADITMDDLVEQIDKQGYVSINDCCCGAGANLIAAINSARRKLEDAGLNFQNHILIIGQDIEELVALMCYIQISLLGVAGYIKVGNALTKPMASFHTLLKYHAAIYLICHGFSPFKNRRGRRLSPYSPTPPHWSYSSGYSSPAYFSANSSSSMTTYSERR